MPDILTVFLLMLPGIFQDNAVNQGSALCNVRNGYTVVT